MYIYVMRRTTVFLEDLLLRRARAHARREGRTFASLVREAVAVYIAEPRPRGAGLPSIAGRFASGAADTADRTDELLWKDPHA